MKLKNGNLNSPKNSPSYVLQFHLLIKSNLYLHSPWKFEDPGFKGTLLFNRINQHTTFSTRNIFLGSVNAQDWAFTGHYTMIQTWWANTGSSAQLSILSSCLIPDGHGALLCDREKMTLLLPGGLHAEVSHTHREVNWVHRWFCWFWQPERKQKDYI